MPSQIVAILPSHSTTTLSQPVNRHSSAVSCSRLLSSHLIATPSLPVDRHSSLPIGRQSPSHLSTTLFEPVYRHFCPANLSPLSVAYMIATLANLFSCHSRPVFDCYSHSAIRSSQSFSSFACAYLSNTCNRTVSPTGGIPCRTPTPCTWRFTRHTSNTFLRVASTAQSSYTPLHGDLPLLIRLTRSQESDSPSFKPHLCLPEG